MFNTKIFKITIAVFSVMSLAGCMSFQPLEPIKNPPLQYRNDTVVPVEFVNPMEVGFRCAERGAKFLNMPGVNSKACASTDLVTMPNPCMTITGGWYAELLCHELAHANGWSPKHEGGNWLPDQMVHGSATPQLIAEKEEAPKPELKKVETVSTDAINAVDDGNAFRLTVDGSEIDLNDTMLAALQELLDSNPSPEVVKTAAIQPAESGADDVQASEPVSPENQTEVLGEPLLRAAGFSHHNHLSHHDHHDHFHGSHFHGAHQHDGHVHHSEADANVNQSAEAANEAADVAFMESSDIAASAGKLAFLRDLAVGLWRRLT